VTTTKRPETRKSSAAKSKPAGRLRPLREGWGVDARRQSGVLPDARSRRGRARSREGRRRHARAAHRPKPVRREREGSINSSIPTARLDPEQVDLNAKARRRRFPGFLQSPLTDSNRRPPPYHPGPVATGRNWWQRFWLVSPVFAACPFATGCHWLRPLCSINAPYPVGRKGNTRAVRRRTRPPRC